MVGKTLTYCLFFRLKCGNGAQPLGPEGRRISASDCPGAPTTAEPSGSPETESHASMETGP